MTMWRKSTLDSSHYAIKAVRDYAIAAHGDQKYGDEPYVVHLDAVAEIVRRYGATAVKLAYLHDVIEDTKVLSDRLCKDVGDYLYRCIILMSKPCHGSRASKTKCLNEQAAKLKASDWAFYAMVFIVKPADRLANVRASVKGNRKGWMKQYRREHAEFVNAFHVPGLCDEIWAELDDLFAQSAPKV